MTLLINAERNTDGTDKNAPADAIQTLIDIMAILRDPEKGCPWDLEQTLATLSPYVIEEAYEVADALERDAMPELKAELGDLLFQIVFQARLAEEAGLFDFADIARAVGEKMIFRHPHVFGDDVAANARDVEVLWDKRKESEKAGIPDRASVLDDVTLHLPALLRAQKLQKRAARVGFDWPNKDSVFAKLREELAELDAAIESRQPDAIEDELGDVFFVLANLARKLDIESETATRRACDKFSRRFRYVERSLAEAGSDPGRSTLAEMEALWQQAKREGL